MNIADKLTTIAENQQQLYAAGYAKGQAEGGGSAEGAVLYTEQTLTEEQKAQARKNIGAVSEEQIDALDDAVFETVEVVSANLFNPNTVEQAVVANSNCFISEVIPCKDGDVIYAGTCGADGSWQATTYGIRQINADGNFSFTTASASGYGGYTVAKDGKTPDLIGVEVIVWESRVAYADRATVMVTINEKPAMFSPWAEPYLQKVNLIEKNQRLLQEQIDGMRKKQVEVDPTLTEAGKAADAKIVGEKFSTMDSFLSNLEKTKNLFDENNYLPNMRIVANSGTPYEASGMFTTDYIEVSVGDKLVASYDKNGVRTLKQIDAVAIYDADKNFKVQSSVSGTNRFVNVYDVAVNDTAFVRLTFTSPSGTTSGECPYQFMIEKAESISSEYEPYGYKLGAGGGTTSRWKGKNVLVFGDSISSDTYMNNSPKWNHFLQREKDFVHHNYSIHGYGFLCGQGTDIPGDRSMIMQIENAKNAFDASGTSPDLIILFMGTNDAGNHVPLGEYETGMTNSTLTTAITDATTISTFTMAVEYCMAKILEYWCGVPVAVLLPLKRQGYVNPDGAYYLWKYADVLQTTAEKFAFPVLDLYHKGYFNAENANFRSMYTHDWDGSGNGDGLHPTQWWSENRLAPMIGSFIENI